MSKLFTILAASLIAVGAGAAGYVYFTGPIAASGLPSSGMGSPQGDGSGCPLCQMASKRRSCCDGAAEVKKVALESGGACCEADELQAKKVAPTDSAAAVLGGLSFAACTAAKSGGCCEMDGEEPGNAVASLVGIAVTLAKK